MSIPTQGTPPPLPENQDLYGNSKHTWPTKKKTMTGPVIISGLIGLTVGIAATLGTLFLMVVLTEGQMIAEPAPSDPPVSAADQSSEESTDDDVESPAPIIAPTQSAFEPTVDDFEIETSVKEERCFGSAGCNLTLRTEPAYVGTEIPSGSWEITYELTGIDDSPMIRTLELNDDEFSFRSEVSVSVPSRDSEVVVTVTEVREGF